MMKLHSHGSCQLVSRDDCYMTFIQNVPYRLTYDCSLQLLHCFEHVNGTGGVTILADGFYGATRLKEEHSEDFQLLTTLDVDAEYLEDGHHHRNAAPIITIDKRTKDIVQIRYALEYISVLLLIYKCLYS